MQDCYKKRLSFTIFSKHCDSFNPASGVFLLKTHRPQGRLITIHPRKVVWTRRDGSVFGGFGDPTGKDMEMENENWKLRKIELGGDFQSFFLFSHLFGEMMPFWLVVFQISWNQQLV